MDIKAVVASRLAQEGAEAIEEELRRLEMAIVEAARGKVQLTAERDALKAEVERWKSEARGSWDRNQALIAEVERLKGARYRADMAEQRAEAAEADNARLRAALRRYGGHLGTCEIVLAECNGIPCTCGLVAALSDGGEP